MSGTRNLSVVMLLSLSVLVAAGRAIRAGSDCCEAHATPGCDDPDCEATVCSIDPFCCDVQWDANCAAEATGKCGDLCAVPCPTQCAGGQCCVTQSFAKSGNFNAVSCTQAVGAQFAVTDQGHARCFDLATEGVPAGEDLIIDSVKFGVRRVDVNVPVDPACGDFCEIPVNVNIYVVGGCSDSIPFASATLLNSQPAGPFTVEDRRKLFTVAFPGGVTVQAGSALLVEIELPEDGHEAPNCYDLRPMASNTAAEQCAQSYLRAPDCPPADIGWVRIGVIGPALANRGLLLEISGHLDTGAPVVCGDGSLGGCEDCDDGNTICGDGCDHNCQSEPFGTCGDGVVSCVEQCDYTLAAPVTGESCSATCQYIPICGDDMVQAGEDCDGCNNSCPSGLCGAPGSAAPCLCAPLGCQANEDCDDGNACTINVCLGGECFSTPVDCNDGNDCTIDSCDPASGCTYTPECTNDADCDDGDPATSDACLDGCCVNTLLTINPCPTDFTRDGQTNASDLALLLGAWGICQSCPADLNGDGVVNPLDLAFLLGHWGSGPGQCGNQVHGSVYTVVAERGQEPRNIYLPGVQVFLQNLQNGQQSPPTTTGLEGWYATPAMPPGQYALCVEAPGYQGLCLADTLMLQDLTLYPQPILIPPDPGVLFGRVLFADGSVPFFLSHAFDVYAKTTVRLLDQQGFELASVPANLVGDFVIPAVSAGAYFIEAQIEDAMVTLPVSFAGDAQEVNLTVSNSRPQIATTFASVGGVGIRFPAPGTTVEVTVEAVDADGDALHYNWLPSAAGAPFVSTDSPTVSWTLPAVSGLHTMYVLVGDGDNGGYALDRVGLSTGTEDILFTGTVTTTAGAVIAGASVTVNGVAATTDIDGFFALGIPRTDPETNRFVMNIEATCFQSLSKVFTAPVVGGSYTLVAAELFVIDPTGIVEVTDSAGATVQIPPNALVNAQGQAPTGLLNLCISTFDLCDPGRFPGDYGALTSLGQDRTLESFGLFEVNIKDSNGVAYNLAPGQTATIQIPIQSASCSNCCAGYGLTGCDDPECEEAVCSIDPFCCAVAWDELCAGLAWKLCPECSPQPPPSIPLWFYDEAAGLWMEEGTATLVGNVYVASVAHFSEINADVEFSNPACLKLVIDKSTLPTPFTARVTVPTGGSPKILQQLVQDDINVLYRLPMNAAIKIEALNAAGQVYGILKALDESNNPISGPPASNVTVDSGGHACPDGDTPTWAYPSCKYVKLALEAPTPTGVNSFLTFGQGNVDGYRDTAENAQEYYAAIDPFVDPIVPVGPGMITTSGTTVTGVGTTFTTFFVPGDTIRAGGQSRLITSIDQSQQTLQTFSAFNPALSGVTYEKVGTKPTLDRWKTANDFGSGVGPPHDDADAVYFNDADLGFGRWMHMKKSVTTLNAVAYYVSNYAGKNADIVALAKKKNDPTSEIIATVAMEYSPATSGGIPFTKFYVFDATGKRVPEADLDPAGFKYIPSLCVICHGGNPDTSYDGKIVPGTNPYPKNLYPGSPPGNLGARFIPFALESFIYSELKDNNNISAYTRTAQEAQFKMFNQAIHDRTNTSVAINELIEGWYFPALGALTQNSAYVPPLWSTPQAALQLYQRVVQPSCRLCHATRDEGLDWREWSHPSTSLELYYGFKEHPSIKPRVCQEISMPNARRTNLQFWLEPTLYFQPFELQSAGIVTPPCPYP